MWDFLKKIFSKRGSDVTVVVIDDADPEQQGTFRIQSADMIRIALLIILISVILTTVLFFITPLGSLYGYQQDESLRQEIVAIAGRVTALQDSLEARDLQLNSLKRVLVETPDTVFQTGFSTEPGEIVRYGPGSGASGVQFAAYEMLSRNEIVFSEVLSGGAAFPSPWPLEGTLSQGFSPGESHYGIDIAAKEGTEFHAIADGTVISTEWSVNYGYVIYLQHAEGYMSVYKHGASLRKSIGDIIIRGDILGTVGDKGALSTGSHLHLEIWKNGVAQDPTVYLIK